MARFGELSTCYTGKNATDEILNISTMVRPTLKMIMMKKLFDTNTYMTKISKIEIFVLTSLAHILSVIDSLPDFSHHLKTFQRIDIEVWMHRHFVQFRQVQICTDPLRPTSTSKLNSKWIVNDGSKWKKMKSESGFTLGKPLQPLQAKYTSKSFPTQVTMPYICPTAMRKNLSYTRDYILIANFIGDDGTKKHRNKV